MKRTFNLSASSTLVAVVSMLPCLPSHAQRVGDAGFAELADDKTFYIEVPMVDDTDLPNYGVGGNIVAESIINSVRYAGNHPEIRHVVFEMDTGGGALFHAEAMEDIIERHHRNTEFHIVVQNAISAGIWTAFSCDTIFMCRAGTIGGATAYFQLSDDEVMVADDIPQIAARLAKTAERNGYPPEIIEPLMLMKTELHTWIDESGQRVLAHKKPDDAGSLTDYQSLDRSDTVLTLTARDAIEIGIARPIDDFDAALVGKELGVPGWTLANRYGQVVDEIGTLYNTTRAMEDRWRLQHRAQPLFPVTPQNRNNEMIREQRKNLDKYTDVLDALRDMNRVLNELPDIHPERYIYFAGDDGVTVVEDAEQWEADAKETRTLGAALQSGMRRLFNGYRLLEIDTDNLEHIEAQVKQITSRINGITTHGNATYWDKEEQDD